MAQHLISRATVQALFSVDHPLKPPAPPPPPPPCDDQHIVAVKQLDSHLAGAPIAVDCQIPAKRKRGRPPRSSGTTSFASPVSNDNVKRSKKEDEEEDVCFICFDGGSLVLCDRRECPKAYHPACVKRDESFFRPNIRWNCGWHLCNICQRNALFMCYTCPYSLCKGCVKHADILCVRGNKGFCRNCMTTIMLIENIPQGNKVQVDFDDTTSWEYLFKVYWVLLKQKELFTSDELIQATNPWKVSGLEHKDDFPKNLHDPCVIKVSELNGSVIHLEANGSKRRKMRKQTLLPNTDIQKLDKADDNKVSCLHGRADWATKELLEFVAHMKNGDTSVLSQFDVQALLLDYIRTNNLRDPRQKCQIICDGRLLNLFGKSHVGHFEMLKLVEYHFKEGCRTNGKIRGASVDPVAGQVEAVGINRDIQIPSRNMKQQAQRCDVKGRASNLDCYAAIDAHNINLVYLKRSLLENLMVDVENFHDMMVGSIVRIRITSNDQKQDMHRLVRIIGTTKATEPYKVGDKTQNIMLRILNLNKIEDVTLDGISDQDFSEDECRRLRQSIKLGLVERMTVGEIQEKAMALQTVRVDGWLESEITRLNHLRDRASEMGHRKELRECVEKIELLKTPGERQRRISEIPKVHDDPRMDPCYGSDDDSGESDTEKQDGSVSRYKSNSKVVMESSSPVKVGDTLKHANVKSPKTSAVNGERKRKVIAKFHVGRMEGATRHLRSSQKSGTGRVDVASTSLEEPNIQADSGVGSSDQGAAKIKSMSQSAHSSTANPSSGKVSVSDSTELEKIWRYEDPSGKVQGPFCMLQLRKWNSSGYFPIDLKVWRVNETQLQSVLLSDALRKQLPNELHNGAKSDEKRDGSIEEPNSTTSPHLGCKPNEGSRSNLTSRVDTSDGIEQCKTDHNSDGQFCEYNIRTHPTKRSFMIEERNLDAAVNSTLGMVHMSTTTETSHMTCKTELSVHSSPAARSDNVKMENQPVNNGSLSQDTGAPDSVTVGIMTSNGLDASEVPSSVSKSEPKDLKGLNMEENKHPVTSDVCRDFGASRATGASSMECYDVPGPTTKTGNNDHDIENNRSSGSVEHDSGINSKVCGEADVSLLPLAASMVDNQILKPHDANKHPVTSDVCRDFGASRATGASSMECYDVPGPTTKTGNNDHDIENNRSSGSVEHDSGINSKVCGEVDVSVVPLAASMVDNQILKPHDAENRHFITSNVSQKVSSSSCHIFAPVDENVKTHDAENKHYVGSNVPGQDSGLSWSTMSGEVVFSDLPAASKLENEGLKTSAAGSKHCDAANVARQHSAASWITISGGIEFADLPTTSMKLEDEGMRDRAVENKHHLPSNIPIQNSCISWSTASSLVGEVHLHDVPGEWGAFPFVHAKPSVEGINLVSCSSAKLAEVAGGHPIPTSNSCQLTLCSTDHDDCDSLGWQPIELSTLGDESVSDLLSEVEAMESLRGISPTSRMDCGDVSIDSPRDDCFSPLDGLTLNIDPGKNNDIQFHIHHNHVDQHQVAFSIDINDIPRTTCILSNPSPDVGEGKPAMVSLALHDFFSEAPSPSLLPPPPPPPPLPPPPAPPPPPPPPLTINLEIPPSPVEEGEVDPIHVSVHLPEVAPKKQPPPRNVTMDKASADTGKQGQMFGTTRREPPSQENVKVSSSGSILGNPNLHWSNSTHVILPASVNMHRSTSVRSQGTRASQTSPRYSHGAGRHSVPKDRSHHHHGVDSGFSKSRPTLWSRQSSGGGGGGSSRPAHRGQRVCKFYESGYCKRGAACKYLHP